MESKKDDKITQIIISLYMIILIVFLGYWLIVDHKTVAHFKNGSTLRSLKKSNEAIEQYQQAIKLNPKFYLAYDQLADIFIELKKNGEAIKIYQKALEKIPGLFQTHLNLGTLLLNTNRDFSGAIDHFRQAISISPNYAKAHNNLGGALAQQGKFAEAISHFEKAISIDPNYTQAQKYLNLARSKVLEQANE